MTPGLGSAERGTGDFPKLTFKRSAAKDRSPPVMHPSAAPPRLRLCQILKA
jgi:hypothetical protein